MITIWQGFIVAIITAVIAALCMELLLELTGGHRNDTDNDSD